GAEMIRRLRAEGAEVPILAMTGHPGEVGEEEPRPVGVSAVLNKPLRMDELVRALQAATLQAPEL
ncbi:MAG: response regulator, partial [bacterium]|nr:response regulator [bacterium]